MGSGKSSVAQRIGELLRIAVIETDTLVLQRMGMRSMNEVFAVAGEEALRRTEGVIAQEIASMNEGIISTGGGFVLHSAGSASLKESGGQIFFLDASFRVIAQRLANDLSRPLFRDPVAAEFLYRHRRPIYLQCANYVIPTDERPLSDIAFDVIRIALQQ